MTQERRGLGSDQYQSRRRFEGVNCDGPEVGRCGCFVQAPRAIDAKESHHFTQHGDGGETGHRGIGTTGRIGVTVLCVLVRALAAV